MATKFKDSVKRPNGRPRNEDTTERQALIQREIIRTLKPLYKPAAEVLARLAGIKLPESSSLVIEDEKNKTALVSATVKCTAAKTIMDKFEEAIYNQYNKEDGTPAKTEESEVVKPTARVLSLTVKPSE